MRTGIADDMLLEPQSPESPAPEMPIPLPAMPPAALQMPKTSSIVGMMPMPMPMTLPAMSPDALLRAYAEGRAVASPPPTPGGLPLPAPAANYNGNGMRTLYSPATTDSPKSEYTRKSLAPTEYSKYDDDDAYIGTAE